MKQLWTPWRRAYVTRENEARPACVFCQAFRERDSEGSLVVHVGHLNFILMNLYPYNAGHLLVVPRAHVGSLAEVAAETLSDMMVQVQLAGRVLSAKYRPQGFNVGMNLGREGGAGVPDHIHMHVVPRWQGDTNFMTVLGELRVITEELSEATRDLKKLFGAFVPSVSG